MGLEQQGYVGAHSHCSLNGHPNPTQSKNPNPFTKSIVSQPEDVPSWEAVNTLPDPEVRAYAL